ncbi:BglG family transcription antiterminator [Oceanobacillus sp. Castelsardo]|uniref:BglG family transcription antiterminator n=1 Tax=Oceanobacillus sp. Castelsardo TaxID=1851204 RepID=UPI001E3E651D|nr:BglG family transcription antiterminator [Oceanobacillus sp. Castelsardo]
MLLHLLTAVEEVKVKDLAEILEVSERTIHRDLKKIEHTLADYHLKLEKKMGLGLRIEGKSKDKEQLHSLIIGEAATDFTPEERKAIILTMLLEKKEPIKLFTLAHELGVTSATISSDLNQLEDEVESFDLSIVRQKGLGIRIEGNEAKKRSALSHLISQNIHPIGLANQLKKQIQQNSKRRNHITNRLMDYVNPKDLEIIEKRVEQACKNLPYELAESGYVGLVVHLTLAIQRLQNGDVIHFDEDYLQKIEGTEEYKTAKKIIQELEFDLSLNIPVDEIGYITMHLLGAKLRTDRNNLMEDNSLDIALKANELIRNVSKLLKKDLADNNKLLNDLTIHLKPAVFRLKQGMTIKNPMLKEIKRDYFDFFQIVQKGVVETFPDINFPEDEIGYLVLHFAATLLQVEGKSNLKALVICSSGIGTSKILATKLMQKIPEIREVENKSLFDLEDDVMREYDLIVSTIPLEKVEGNYILTSPMLTEAEIHRIKKEIRKKSLIPKRKRSKEEKNYQSLNKLETIENYSRAIMSLLRHFSVQSIPENQSVETILKSICMELEECKIINNKESVLLKLLSREKLGGLGIPNTYLSLYHTRSVNVMIPSFSIYSLRNPLIVRGMDGEEMEIHRVLLMLAPDVTSNEVLEIFSYLSSLIIQEQETVRLFTNENEQQLKQFLANKLYDFIKEKI